MNKKMKTIYCLENKTSRLYFESKEAALEVQAAYGTACGLEITAVLVIPDNKANGLSLTEEKLKEDAQIYGVALNDAGWEFQDAYHEITGSSTDAKLFNNTKAILRSVIIKYIERVFEEENDHEK